MKKCKVCGGLIHPARIAIQPRVVTCSSYCSEENTRALRRQAAKRANDRNRELLKRAREAEKDGVLP